MRSPVTVVTAEFEDLVKVGLRQLISEDENLHLVASDVPLSQISAAIEEHAPAVVLLNFGSLPTPGTVHQLHERHPRTRLVVLANRPRAPAVVLLTFGPLPPPGTVHQLHERHPGTRVVVLANRPTAAECNQMLS